MTPLRKRARKPKRRETAEQRARRIGREARLGFWLLKEDDGWVVVRRVRRRSGLVVTMKSQVYAPEFIALWRALARERGVRL